MRGTSVVGAGLRPPPHLRLQRCLRCQAAEEQFRLCAKQLSAKAAKPPAKAAHPHVCLLPARLCAVDDVSLQTGLPAPSTLYSAHETLRAFDTALPEVGHCWKTGSWRASEGHAAPTVDPPWLPWSTWQGSQLLGHERVAQPACWPTLVPLLSHPLLAGRRRWRAAAAAARVRSAAGDASRGQLAAPVRAPGVVVPRQCGCVADPAPGASGLPSGAVSVYIVSARCPLSLCAIRAPHQRSLACLRPHPAPAAACAWRRTGAPSPTCC